MIQKRLLLFFISLLPWVMTSCHDDDDDLIGLWETVAEFSGAPRSGAAAFTIGSKGYIVGGLVDGKSAKDLWVYDMDMNRWDRIYSNDTESDINFPGLARHYGVGVGCEYNKKGYFGLGYNSEYSYETLTLAKYDTGELVNLSEQTSGRLFDWWEFDPVGNAGQGQWRRLPDFPETDARQKAIGFCIGNKVYVGLGDNKDQGALSDIYEYNVDTDTWNKTHIGYPGSKKTGASVFVIDDIAYIFAGGNNNVVDVTLYAYDPSQTGNEWTRLRDISNTNTNEDYDDEYTMPREHGSTFVIDGYGYLTCGNSGGLRTDTWQYNPTTDLWEKVHAFKGGSRMEAVSFSTGRKEGAFVLTGRSSTNYYDDVWNLNPYVWDEDD